MNIKEINALISLLEDPDEEVFMHIRERLLSIGEPIIPELESVWEQNFEPLMQQRIETIIHTIQFEKTHQAFVEWASSKHQNLLQGMLLVAKYQYPDLDEVRVRRQLDIIKQDVWLELNDNLTALEKVKVINHIFFDVHHFSGNTSNYHAPQNSYLNNVLESKKGNPISLSVVYAIIAQELDIPIYGVNLPEHFILAYVDEHAPINSLVDANQERVLFYINAFSKGAVFSNKEIEQFLKQLKQEPQESFFQPCSNIQIIKRMLRNLIVSYGKLGYPSKIKELEKLHNSLSDFE